MRCGMQSQRQERHEHRVDPGRRVFRPFLISRLPPRLQLFLRGVTPLWQARKVLRTTVSDREERQTSQEPDKRGTSARRPERTSHTLPRSYGGTSGQRRRARQDEARHTFSDDAATTTPRQSPREAPRPRGRLLHGHHPEVSWQAGQAESQRGRVEADSRLVPPSPLRVRAIATRMRRSRPNATTSPARMPTNAIRRRRPAPPHEGVLLVRRSRTA